MSNEGVEDEGWRGLPVVYVVPAQYQDGREPILCVPIFGHFSKLFVIFDLYFFKRPDFWVFFLLLLISFIAKVTNDLFHSCNRLLLK